MSQKQVNIIKAYCKILKNNKINDKNSLKHESIIYLT